MIRGFFKRCAGLDVHSLVIVATVLIDEGGESITRVTREFKTFHSDLKVLAAWLHDQAVEMVAMESTGLYWRVVYEALEDADVPGIVVNARHMRNVPGHKTDVQDSEWIADLLRCGLLKASFIPPRDFRELRMLTRYRRKLVTMRASEKQRVIKTLDSAGVKLGFVVSSIDGASAQKMIDALIVGHRSAAAIAELAQGRLRLKVDDIKKSLDGKLTDRHRFALREIRAHIVAIGEAIGRIDDQVFAALQPYRQEWLLLQTIPGLEEASAAALLAEIGVDMRKFGSKEQISSWAALCPGTNESAGKRKSGRTTKGNQHIKSLLCECAHSAARTKSQFKGLHDGLLIRRGKKRAIIAVAHKQLEVAYTILKKREPYHDPAVNYDQLVIARNAPRWIKSLQRYGYLERHGELNHPIKSSRRQSRPRMGPKARPVVPKTRT